MVTIRYDQENTAIFELVFPLREPTQQKQLQFYLELFERENVPLTAKLPLVWSVHFCYELGGMPFRMVYDEDYGLVRFAAGNAAYRQPLAQALKQLIEARYNCVKGD